MWYFFMGGEGSRGVCVEVNVKVGELMWGGKKTCPTILLKAQSGRQAFMDSRFQTGRLFHSLLVSSLS